MTTTRILYKRRLLFVLFIFCFSALLFSQKVQFSDSIKVTNHLKTFINTSKSTKKIKKLIRNSLKKEKDTLKSLELAKLFLERGIRERDDTIQYFSAYQIGFINYNASNHLEVINYLQKALNAAYNLKDTTRIIHSNLLIGSSYYLLGAYHESTRHYLEAKKLSKHINNAELELVSLTNLANNRLKLNRIIDALHSYNDILELLRDNPNNRYVTSNKTQLSAMLGKGKCLSELGREREALLVLNELVELSENEADNVMKGYAFVNIGDLFYKRGEYNKALSFLKDSKRILLDNPEAQKTNLVLANYYIAKCFTKQNRNTEALELLNIIFSEVNNKPDIDKIEKMYELAITNAKKINNDSLQLYFYDELQDLVKLKAEKQLAARDLLFEEDLKTIEEENQQLKIAKDKSILKRNIILIIAIALIIVLVVFILKYRTKTKNNEKRFLQLIDDLESKKLNPKQKVVSLNKYPIKDEKAKKILKALQDLEKTNFYLSKDCDLYSTAKLLNTNTSYLSKTLNKLTQQTFNQYLNELRINYALLQLKDDPLFRSYTIRAVASEVGYKSHTTFIKVFKEKTGVTPSYYIKKLG